MFYLKIKKTQQWQKKKTHIEFFSLETNAEISFYYRKIIKGERGFFEWKRRAVLCYNEFKTLYRYLVRNILRTTNKNNTLNDYITK